MNNPADGKHRRLPVSRPPLDLTGRRSCPLSAAQLLAVGHVRLGVDYFSSLGYQPSLTYELAGPFGPLATLAVVLVTLLVVLPLYMHMARKSPDGLGRSPS